MALRPTEESMAGELKPDEQLIALGWASRAGTKFFFVGLTPERFIIQKLSMTYKVKGSQDLPLAEVASVELEEGFKYAKPTQQMLSKMSEHSLYIKTTSGDKVVFRFPKILGVDNLNVPNLMVEYMEGR
jgi:hypothetical protein